MRKLVKRWNTAPKLKSPVATTVNWPVSPLLLKWTPVAHAVNYQLKIGTSPSLSSLVYGPTNVQGPEFAFPSALAPGTYYWSVQPIDASGDLGKPSVVRSFNWAWPSQTTLNESDVSPDSAYEEPSFSWTAIPGASNYEIQVATLPSYPTNAIILDSTGLIGTNYTAQSFFPDHTTLYWRLRAVDCQRRRRHMERRSAVHRILRRAVTDHQQLPCGGPQRKHHRWRHHRQPDPAVEPSSGRLVVRPHVHPLGERPGLYVQREPGNH